MANPIYRTYTTLDSGPQDPVNLDWLPFTSTTIAVWCDGEASYSVEGTLDDVNSPAEGGQPGANPPRWFPLTEFPAMTTGSKYAAIENPWLWLRLNIEMTTGNIELKIQQASDIIRG